MSFNQKVNGRGYAPGFFLASADCDRETVEVSASHAQAVTIGDKKIVPAGAVIPSNDGNAKGILYEDGSRSADNGYDIVFTRIPRRLIRRQLTQHRTIIRKCRIA